MNSQYPLFEVHFIARQSAYFWVGAVTWTFVTSYAVLGSTVLSVLGEQWLPIGALGLAVVLLIAALVVRSGVTFRADGTVDIVDGYRTYKLDPSLIKEFVIVDSVALVAAPLLMLGTGPFAPDRLGVLLNDGTTVKLNWSFANHDDIRMIRKRLNARLTLNS